MTNKVGVRMSSKDKSTKVTSTAKAGAVAPKAAASKKNAKTIVVKTENSAEVRAKSVDKKAKPGNGLVVRKKEIDPELALMASRTESAERSRPDVIQMKQNGRSVSGMVSGRPARRANTAYSVNVQREKVAAERREQKETEEAESRFSKMKSALIGVGVALVVAVVGFAGIAIFGNNKKMCTVYFEANGGSEVAGTEIVCGRTVKQPDDPAKEGFSFEGWMLEGDPFDFSTGIYKNATLVAKWKANEGTEIVTVKFDSDGGTKVNDVEVAKGKKLSRPNAPTKIGYVFDDWYLNDKEYDFNQPVNANITLKAKWNKRPAVENNNGGTANNGGANNKPSEKKYAESLSVADASVNEGESVQVAVTVLPSAAETYMIASSSDNEIASCNVTGTTVICAGKKPGVAVITVKDDLSGNRREFTLTVTHVHHYEDGKCTGCGEIDPNHEHNFSSTDGKCTICGAEHEHDFGDNAPTCSGCGVKNPNHTHDFGDNAPTCTVPGCNAENPGYVPPHEHNFGEDGKAPKCTVPGCNAVNPNHDHSYGDDGRCTICGAEKPANSGESGDNTGA